jgi:hypothetical protein
MTVRRADVVAGYLCAFSFALSGIALVRAPGVLATASVVVALVAARMSEARATLAAWAVGFAAFAFVAGMLVAIATDASIV